MRDMSTVYVSTAGNDVILLDDPDATTATKKPRAGLTLSSVVSALTVCATIFSPPSNAVPLVGGGGLCPNASALAQYVMATYPGVTSIGGVRSDALPDHPSGHALDIMIGGNPGLGDTISADVRSQSSRFGVSYILWRVANHYDHVHVTVF